MSQACASQQFKQLTFAEFTTITISKKDLKYHHCASDERTAWGQCQDCGYIDDCAKLKFSIKESKSSRDEFMAYGCGCCGFSEEKLLCTNPKGIFCQLKMRIEYRCPIRNLGEPEASPSHGKMIAWKKEGLNPRNGQPLKGAKPDKPKRQKKYPYRISIRFAPEDSSAFESGCKYIYNSDKSYGNCSGAGGPAETKEEVIQSCLRYMGKWEDFDSILGRKGDPVTIKSVLFDDETGEFSINDFFTSEGSPWPPNNPKKKISKRPSEAGTGGGKQPVHEGSCGTCSHHKGRKTFHESCPRLSELLFKGGTKSAKVLMDETSIERCEHWTAKLDHRCHGCGSSKTCNTHKPEKELCVARALK